MQGDRVQAFPSPIRSIALTMRERHLIVGDEEVSLSSLSWALIGPRGREVPVIGLSHSLGGKLMALSNSRKQDRRKVPPKAANIFLAFNNYSLKQSIALSQDQLPADLLSDIQVSKSKSKSKI